MGNEPFAVILPDDVIAAEKPCLQQMVEAYEETGGNVVAAMEVPPEKTSSYGILDIKQDMGSIVSVKGMVEKPAKGTEPSNLAVIGRYILTPHVMSNLNKMKVGAGGEIQLTDAIAQEIEADRPVSGSAGSVSIAGPRPGSCRRPCRSRWRVPTCAMNWQRSCTRSSQNRRRQSKPCRIMCWSLAVRAISARTPARRCALRGMCPSPSTIW
jgi:hypothetical protein